MKSVREIMGPPQGDYKGVVNFRGILVGLEVVDGDKNPSSGQKLVGFSYGDIPKRKGVDGDPIDVILGSDWQSDKVFVLQDAHGSDSDSPKEPKQYGEDKVALGFPTEKEAIKAWTAYYQGDNRAIVGCIETTVDAIRERTSNGDEDGIPWMNDTVTKSIWMAKSNKPPAGFMAFGSKKGGYRKRKSSGGWLYWYPTEDKAHHTLDWEPDPKKGLGVDSIEAGAFIHVGGRKGLFVWTPDHAETDEKHTWVTPYDAAHKRAGGTPERVAKQSIQPMRSFDLAERKAEKKRKKKKAIARPRKRTQPRAKPPVRAKPPIVVGTPAKDQPPVPKDLEGVPIGAEARRAAVYADSQAAEGTFLHKLENGEYMLAVYKDNHQAQNRREWAVFVPQADQAGMLQEFGAMIHAAARDVAKSHRIAMFNDGGETAEFEEVKSGAILGFVLSLRAFAGGQPFALKANDYCRVYATKAARETLTGGSAAIPHRQMQLVHGFIAARSRASQKTDSPTQEAIARSWYLPKRLTFTGANSGLGVYSDGDKVIDQAHEQVPNEPWQVKGPDGTEHGKVYPGKLQLIGEMERITAGDRVADSEWMNQNEGSLLPVGGDSTLPQGTQHHLRAELETILAKMPSSQAETLTVLFGLEREGLAGDTPQAESRRQSKSRTGLMSDYDLAVELGLALPKDSDRTVQRKGERARSAATATYKEIANQLGAESANRVKRWTAARSHVPKVKSVGGFSYNDLKERFGSDDRVQMFMAGQRAGEQERVGKLLDKEKAGKLSKKQSETLREWFYTRRREERQRQFEAHSKTHTVDPSLVHDTGPQRGTDPASSWLYAEEILTNHLQNMLHPKNRSKVGREKGTSRVMSEERFLRFMGREGRRKAAETQGDSNE